MIWICNWKPGAGINPAPGFVVCSDLLCECFNVIPPFGRQARERKQKATAEIVLFAVHDIADETHDLLVARNLDEHFTIAGAQPMFADAVRPAYGCNHNIRNGRTSVFNVIDHVPARTERCAKSGLRKPQRLANIFNSAIRISHLLCVSIIYHDVLSLSTQKARGNF